MSSASRPSSARFRCCWLIQRNFSRIEPGWRAVDRRQIEPFDEIVHGKYLVVAVRPTEARQIVQERFRQIAVLLVLQHAHRPVPLRQPLAVVTENHRHVGVVRQRCTQRPQDVDLAWRVVDVVVAANDVCDVHVEIIDHDAEVVSRHTVGAQDHQIVELAVLHGDGPLYQVVERHEPIVWIAKADHGFHAGRRSLADRALGPPAAVVAGFQSMRSLGLTKQIELLAGRVAVVGLTFTDQLFRHLPVTVEALHLVEWSLVVTQPQPAHRIENGVGRRLGGALPVGILDAQDEGSTVLPRVRPGEERGARAADVEIAGRARSEAGADHLRARRKTLILRAGRCSDVTRFPRSSASTDGEGAAN